MSPMRLWIIALAVAAAAACGGGGSSTDNTAAATPGGAGGNTTLGTLRVALTDNPTCGYDNVWVTVEKVRIHRDGSAEDGDAGWVDLPLPQQQPLPTPLPAPPPLRVDLLTLTNGTLVPLGQVQLPAGTYSQLRLVLAENTAGNPFANAIKPTGGAMVPLTTPSAQQSGLKMNVNITVPAGQEVDFAIDFDACKSFVKAGKSGKILLKAVLSVLPIVSQTGQRIQGWLHPSLATAGATVSVHALGEVVRATPPMVDSGGNVSTTVNSVAFSILPPVSSTQPANGTVSMGAGPDNTVDTGGVVRALQLLTGGPTIEVASDNAGHDDGGYEMALPLGAPIRAPYVAGLVPLLFTPDAAVMGKYRLAATVARSTEVQFADIVLGAAPVQKDFHFVAP